MSNEICRNCIHMRLSPNPFILTDVPMCTNNDSGVDQIYDMDQGCLLFEGYDYNIYEEQEEDGYGKSEV